MRERDIDGFFSNPQKWNQSQEARPIRMSKVIDYRSGFDTGASKPATATRTSDRTDTYLDGCSRIQTVGWV